MSIVNITEHDLCRARQLGKRVCLEAIEPHLKSVLEVVLDRAGYATKPGLYRWDNDEKSWRSLESYKADQARLAELAGWYADLIAKGGPMGAAAHAQAMSCPEPLKRRIGDILAQRADTL